MMKKWKTLSVFILGALASIFFVGCSCSENNVPPTKIAVNIAETYTFVNETTSVNYSIEPADSSNTKVEVSVNKPNVITLSQTSFDSASGTLTITGNTIDTEGVVVTFAVSGTSLKTSTLVRVMPDPIKLNMVTNVSYSSTQNSILFKNVPNAKNYVVNINGTEYPVTDASTSSVEHYVSLPVFNQEVPLATDTEYTVKVKALGDVMNFTDGDYSLEYKFLKYSPVTNVTANNGVITWDAHKIAPLYAIRVNGVDQIAYMSTNSYTITDTDAKEYAVEIAAANSVSAGDCHTFKSDYSEPYVVTKLAKPTLSLKNDNVVEGAITNSILSFPEVLGATGYKLTVTPAIASGTEFDLTENKFEITEEFVVDTNYTIKVVPLGDASNTIASTGSTITIKRLGGVSNFAIANNILTFDGISSAGGYEVVLTNGQETKTVSTQSTQVNLAEEINAAGTYAVSVRALGLVTSTLNIANGVTTSTGLNITKLNNVNVTAVKNDGTATWDAVDGTNTYAVYLDDSYVNTSSTTSYTLTVSAAGEHNVKVVAVGDGTTTITSGVNNATAYEFNKLSAVSTFTITNDNLKFTAVDGALNYSVKLNDGNYRLVGSNTEAGYPLLDVVDGTNQIYVISVGDDFKNISSNPANFSVTRLSAPTNLRTENGILTWDAAQGNKYQIVVGNSLEATEQTLNTFTAINVVNQEVVVKVKAVPTEGNYISSAYATKTVIKLPSISLESVKTNLISASDTLSNYKLVWGEVENASKYTIEIKNATETYNFEPTTTEVNLPEGYAAGAYTSKLVAVGSTTTEGVGYVSSEPTTFNFRKLGKPTDVTVRNNYLVWTPATGDSPAGYTLEITYNDTTTYVNVGQETSYLFNPDDYKLETISVRVRSVGDNASSITGEYASPFALNRASAIENLRIVNGVITWNVYSVSSATYQVYGTTTPDAPTSYQLISSSVTKGENVTCELTGLEEGAKYAIKVVAVVEGKLNSEPSSSIYVTKLATISNFKISNGVLSWDAVNNATGYVVIDSGNNIKPVTTTSVNFSDFGYTNPGSYSFRVYAVGSQTETTDGYINSQMVASGVTVTVLATATGATITNNVLTILNTNAVLPVQYKIEVTHEDGKIETYTVLCALTEGGTRINLSDWEFSAGAGIYKLEIYSVGNGENLLDNNSPFKLEGITKIDASALGLKISGGEIVWDADVNKTFDVYVNGVLTLQNQTTNTANLTTLEKGVEYSVQLVAKQNGQINSALSPVLKVTKLPDITNFKINQRTLNASTGQSEYYFSWDALSSSTYNTSKLRFEIVPVPATSIEPFNGVTNGNINTFAFSYNDSTPRALQFNIRALGTELETSSGYLTGDMLEYPLSLTILKSLEFISYNRETNTLHFKNENTNASKIQVAYVYALNNQVVHTEEVLANATSFVLNYPEDLEEGVYYVYYNCLGDITNNILMSSTYALTYQPLELLQQATNLHTENGYIKWNYSGTYGEAYQVYLDGQLVTYTTTEPPQEEDGEPILTTHTTFSSASEATIINDLITDTNPHTIYVKVIKEGAIDSRPSESMTIQKLNVTSDARLNNYNLYWSSIANATGYLIKPSNADANAIFANDPDFKTELGGIYKAGADAGSLGVKLPATIPGGIYGFYVVAVGNSVDNTEVGYLTGSSGNIIPVTVLSSVNAISVTDGILTWPEIYGAVYYEVEVYSGQTATDSALIDRVDVHVPQFSLEETKYTPGWYLVRVNVWGNGVTTLNSSLADIREIVVYKSPSPDDYSYKVRDGFVSWEVPIQGDETVDYVPMVLSGTGYDAEAILAAANGRPELTSDILVSNLAHFRTLEVTINGKVFKNQKPISITLNADNTALIYSYDFNFTTVDPTYSVSVKFVGGSTMQNESGDDEKEEPGVEVPGEEEPVESVSILSSSVKVLADENNGETGDGTEGDGTDQGGEGMMPQENQYNVVSSNYSSSISGYKLPAPQSPVTTTKTMVYNDALYFGKVDAGSFEVRYLITAICTNPEQSNESLIIDSSNSSKYLATVNDAVGGASNSIYKVPVADIGIKAGFVYTITVKALGTADSGTNKSGVYFTSLYDHSCSVEMLGTPMITILNGDISFANIGTAVSQELRIWSTGIGNMFDETKANEQANLYAKQISITADAIDNISFLRLDSDGFYRYTLSNNTLFPVSGSYYITCEAMGNGVDKISSGQSTNMLVYKFDVVENLAINAGMFAWKAESYKLDDENSIQAENYTVTIIRRLEGETNAENYEEITTFISSSEIQSLEDCFYDLSSLDFPATNGNGTRYEYALRVAACGTMDSANETEYYTVTGNTVQTTQFYKRLVAPQSIEMVNGTLQWLSVDQATKYEVYKLDVLQTEGEELGSYGIVTDNNYRQLVFNGADFATNQVFSLRIRAIPGTLTTQYLNGEFSEEILCKKLELPNLRVADGFIKWNNTDLNYAIATGTQITITKLETETSTTGTVVYRNDNLEITESMNTDAGLDLSALAEELGIDLGSGYYKVEVGYLGSNGYYNQVVEPENPDEGTEEGGETEVPEGGEGEETETPDPGTEGEGGEGEGEGDEGEGTEEPQPEVLSYCWFSSDTVSMVVYKLETPKAELYLKQDNENPANYVAVELLEKAAFYEFTVVKYNQAGVEQRVYTFDKVNINSIETEQYYERYTDGSGKQYVLFNVQAVADYDALYPNHSVPFGQEFSVYVRAFSYDALYNETNIKIYSISDKSNNVPVEVPITPTELTVNTETGLITWKNYSNNTKTRIKVYYNDATTPVYYSVDAGVSSYKLETIGTFNVSVLSYITTANNLEIVSGYTTATIGEFKIFASGSGTEQEPYELSTSKHVLNMEHYLNSHYVLKNNIAMVNSDLESLEGIIVGRDGGVFNGVLDGAGFSITNIYFTYNANRAALFNEIGKTGVVKNISLGIKTSSINYYVTYLAGFAITNRGTIQNCKTLPQTVVGGEGEIIYNSTTNQVVGGIVVNNYGTITNTINQMNIGYAGAGQTSMTTKVGGIAVNNYGTITMSGNSGALKGTAVGGVASQNLNVIEKSYNTGNITATSLNTQVQALAGGIAANNLAATFEGVPYVPTISYCYSINYSMIVSAPSGGQKAYGGGIVASNGTGTNAITGCYVALPSTISVTNGEKGAIVAIDNRMDATKYVNNFYVATTTIPEMGNSESLDIAVKAATTSELATRLVETFQDIYSQDTNSQNNGYPVLIWQINS